MESRWMSHASNQDRSKRSFAIGALWKHPILPNPLCSLWFWLSGSRSYERKLGTSSSSTLFEKDSKSINEEKRAEREFYSFPLEPFPDLFHNIILTLSSCLNIYSQIHLTQIRLRSFNLIQKINQIYSPFKISWKSSFF